MKTPNSPIRLTRSIVLTDDDVNLIDLVVDMAVDKALAQYLEANPPGGSPFPKFLTKQEAADILKMSVPTLDKRRREGHIKDIQIGASVLIPSTEITKHLENLK